jgi:hypothetical protein
MNECVNGESAGNDNTYEDIILKIKSYYTEEIEEM